MNQPPLDNRTIAVRSTVQRDIARRDRPVMSHEAQHIPIDAQDNDVDRLHTGARHSQRSCRRPAEDPSASWRSRAGSRSWPPAAPAPRQARALWTEWSPTICRRAFFTAGGRGFALVFLCPFFVVAAIGAKKSGKNCRRLREEGTERSWRNNHLPAVCCLLRQVIGGRQGKVGKGHWTGTLVGRRRCRVDRLFRDTLFEIT